MLTRIGVSKGIVLPWSPSAVMAFVAIFGLAMQPLLGALGALLFLFGGVALVVTGPDGTLRTMRREWLLVAMACWCLVSLVWSDYPWLSLRYGTQLLLTVVIGITICTRVSARTFMKILLLVMLVAAAASLATGRAREGGMGFLGIYGSKNALAMTMGVLFLASLAMVMDRGMRMWRVLAVPGVVMGLGLLVMGNSAGALSAMAVAVAMLGPLLLMRRFSASARVVIAAMALILVVAGGVLLSTVANALAAAFLDLTGKDVTLTGRTDLWLTAFGLIAERPLLGVGYQAFWVHGNPLAEDLWAEFGIASRAGFNFHNTPISNMVEIGAIGAGVQLALFVGALLASLYRVMRSRTAEALFFALFMIRQTVTMGVEVVFFFQFDLIAIVTIAAIVYGRAFRGAPVNAPRAS